MRVQEGGVRGTHEDVAREGDLEPRVDGDAVDCADDWKRARLHLVHDVVVEVVLVHLEHALGVAEVDAGAERFSSGGGDDRRADGRVAAKAPERGREVHQHALGDGVHRRGRVDDDQRDAVVRSLDADRHPVPPPERHRGPTLAPRESEGSPRGTAPAHGRRCYRTGWTRKKPTRAERRFVSPDAAAQPHSRIASRDFGESLLRWAAAEPTHFGSGDRIVRKKIGHSQDLSRATDFFVCGGADPVKRAIANRRFWSAYGRLTEPRLTRFVHFWRRGTVAPSHRRDAHTHSRARENPRGDPPIVLRSVSSVPRSRGRSRARVRERRRHNG